MRGMQVWVVSLATLILAVMLGSCGKVAGDGDIQLDSNTNWLKRCESDAECSGALACLCGQCTQSCAETPECGLLAGASCGSVGGACEESPGAGGLCMLECGSASDCEDDDFTCSDGQCVALPRAPAPTQDELAPGAAEPERPEACPAGDGALDMDDVFALIAADLDLTEAEDRVNSRYLSLANRRNAGLCETDLDGERAAMFKMVNSVSRSPSLTLPQPIDATRLIYRIDLRDYEWDQPLNVAGVNHVNLWEALAARDPFFVPWQGDDADAVVNSTGTTSPVMFVSGLVAAATDASTYYALIGMPEKVDDFILGNLGIDRETNFVDQEVIRAGFSGASAGLPNESFLAERHDIEVRSGYLWQLADFGRNVLEDPLGEPSGERELIFTLPNGLLAFALADSDGNRVEQAAAFTNGPQLPLRASFGRYASGVVVSDEVREAASSGAFSERITAGDIDQLFAIYLEPDQLSGVLDGDRESYADALARAEINMVAAEPISRAYAAFEADVDINIAAGDLMLTPDGLRRDLRELDRNMHVLESERVSRSEFTLSYRRSICTLSVALDNSPDIAFCDAAYSDP